MRTARLVKIRCRVFADRGRVPAYSKPIEPEIFRHFCNEIGCPLDRRVQVDANWDSNLKAFAKPRAHSSGFATMVH